MRLLAVPGAPFGRSQPGHDSDESIKTFHNDGELYKICRILMYKRPRGGLVAELAYAYGSGPYSERIAGSSPAQSTTGLILQ